MNKKPTAPVTSDNATKLLEKFVNRPPALDERIRLGIEKNRKGTGRLRFLNSRGRPVTGVKYRLKLVRHEFLFGANAFMLGGLPTAEQNEAYERAFAGIFNSAVVPFYWSGTEPEPGELRFGAESRPIHRRPPTDLLLDFCDKNDLVPKAHCLVWHQFLPKWLPKDPSKVMGLLCKRMDEIAARYGERIGLWDVVNEPMEKSLFPDRHIFPKDYVFKSFEHAQKVFPERCRLILNEATTFSWKEFYEETSGFDLLARNLLLRGARVGGLGMQYHCFFYGPGGMFAPKSFLPDSGAYLAQGQHLLNPEHLLDVLDSYGAMRLPMQISEITLPSYEDIPDGEQLQARLAEELYRVWFSHAGVDGIYWWNLMDGTAHGGETSLKSGLIRADQSPKPAYTALENLIKREWTTALDGIADGPTLFRGFHGDYEIEAEVEGRISKHRFTLTSEDEEFVDIPIFTEASGYEGL